jgi:hypothetical protein
METVVPYFTSLTQLFQFPSFIALSIAATRIHRSLTDFGSKSQMYDVLTFFEARSPVADVFFSSQESLPSGAALPKAWPTFTVKGSNPMMEVSVRTGCEQFPTRSSRTSAMMDHGQSDVSADAPVSTTVYGMSHDARDDPESDMEKGHAPAA